MIELGKNISLDCFDTPEEKYNKLIDLIQENNSVNILFNGEISEITEKESTKCVKHDYIANGYYVPNFPEKQFPDIYKTAKKLLLNICNKKYCIIYKK